MLNNDFIKAIADRLEKASTEGKPVKFMEGSGFVLRVKFPTNQDSVELVQKCQQERWDPKTRRPEKQLDDKRFARGFADMVIADWHGLDRDALDAILPIAVDDALMATLVSDKSKDPDKIHVPYSQDMARWLMENSTTFFQWCEGICMNAKKYNDAVRGYENENLREQSSGSTSTES